MNQRKAGAILSYIGIALNTVVGFLFTPLLISFLGKDQYGLYQLVGSLIAYLNIMDLGLSNTTTRYYSGYKAVNDEISAENILALSGILYAGVSILIILAGLLLFHYFIPLYYHTLSAQEIVLVRNMFYVLLLNLAIVIPSNVFTAIITAHERFIFAKGLILFTTLFRPLSVVAFLFFFNSVMTVVIVQTLFNIFVALLSVWYVLGKLRVKFKLHYWNAKLVKEILTFSFFVCIPGIISIAYWKTGQVILGAVAGAGAVALYATAIQIAQGYMAMSSSMGGIFLPQLSAINAKTDDMTEINAIFLKTSRLQYYFMSYIFLGFVLYGRSFVNLWVGPEFKQVYSYSLILMAGLFVCLVQTTAVPIIQAKNKHAFRAVLYAVLGVINIIVCIPMAKKYGGMGCAITTGLSLLTGQTIIINFYYHKLGIKVLELFIEMIKIIPYMLIAFFVFLFVGLLWDNGKITGFILQGAMFSAAYGIILWFFVFNQYEKDLVKKTLNLISGGLYDKFKKES
ncbi:oligosaccharide flippase family protein [Candidatus Proelusimicrobium excrementi]|uniref:oligosaccharide flippase family protein n=1 Tax=Candidatus Proelusimicrobium excrementi TaxID=3416222 RepID=UPI003D09CBA7